MLVCDPHLPSSLWGLSSPHVISISPRVEVLQQCAMLFPIHRAHHWVSPWSNTAGRLLRPALISAFCSAAHLCWLKFIHSHGCRSLHWMNARVSLNPLLLFHNENELRQTSFCVYSRRVRISRAWCRHGMDGYDHCISSFYFVLWVSLISPLKAHFFE